MVSIRGREVGFLHWMDGHDFRNRLRKAGFLEAVCKAKITEDRLAGDGWDYVGVTIDAFRPFTFAGTDERHSRRAQRDRPLLRSTSGGAGLSTVLKTFRKSLSGRRRCPVQGKLIGQNLWSCVTYGDGSSWARLQTFSADLLLRRWRTGRGGQKLSKGETGACDGRASEGPTVEKIGSVGH